MTQIEACNAYMKMLKETDDLTPELRSIARESFNEGWLQCELNHKRIQDKPPAIKILGADNGDD
jgi:hypothetical protein